MTYSAWFTAIEGADETKRGAVRAHLNFRPSGTGWQALPELPTSAEILAPDDGYEELPKGRIDKPWDDKESYLAAQYKILRKEGTEPLRDSVNEYKAHTYGATNKMVEDDQTCIYTRVRVKGYLFSNFGPIVRVEFRMDRSPLRVNWAKSPRMQPGSLVAISTAKDHFRTVCKIAEIAQRPYLDGLDQNPPLVDLVWNTSEAIFDCATELVMIEPRNGYYESIRHTLVGLQRAARTECVLDDSILGKYDESIPETVQQRKHMDLRPLCSLDAKAEDSGALEKLRNFSILEGIKTISELSSLDTSQLVAVENMLTSRLSIIQGPPGTGKTHTSVAALLVLVQHQRTTGAPIIVSAQTNHAVDQILLKCLEAGISIMRIGSRTDSEVIKGHTPYELKLNRKQYRDAGTAYRALQKARQAIADEVAKLADEVFGDALLDPNVLLRAGIITEAQHKSVVEDDMETIEKHKLAGPLSLWLGDLKIPFEQLKGQDPNADADYEDVPYELDLDAELHSIEEEAHEERISGTFVSFQHIWTGDSGGCNQETFGMAMAAKKLGQHDDLFQIPSRFRGLCYQLFQQKLLAHLSPDFRKLLERYVGVCQEIKALRWEENVQVVRNLSIQIVGCTTTGLTKFRGMIEAMQPRILFVEEAAETREPNISSAIFPSLQQLVLVGDHKQLAPSCEVPWLGPAPFYLNTSLFERLVGINHPYTMLVEQRRMAPALRHVFHLVYPELKDHPSMRIEANRPPIPGMGDKRAWWFDHAWCEGIDEARSRFNEMEAEMVVNFYAYLVNNNTSSEKITVLTYYKGQRRLLLRLLRTHPITAQIDSPRVVTVDSYQGEENDVILLSLVRSPPERNAIGFLESSRRAAVAVSRARRGFYMFGNCSNLLQASQEAMLVWGRIYNGFVEQKLMDRTRGIPLTCRSHGNVRWIKELDDWKENFLGCWQRCDQLKRCGHICTGPCHSPHLHAQTRCTEPCKERCPHCNEGCNRDCGQRCFCMCRATVEARDREKETTRQAAANVPCDQAGQDAQRTEFAPASKASLQTTPAQTATHPRPLPTNRPVAAPIRPEDLLLPAENSAERFQDLDSLFGCHGRSSSKPTTPAEAGKDGDEVKARKSSPPQDTRKRPEKLDTHWERAAAKDVTATQWKTYTENAPAIDRQVAHVDRNDLRKLAGILEEAGADGGDTLPPIRDTYKPTAVDDGKRVSAGQVQVADLGQHLATVQALASSDAQVGRRLWHEDDFMIAAEKLGNGIHNNLVGRFDRVADNRAITSRARVGANRSNRRTQRSTCHREPRRESSRTPPHVHSSGTERNGYFDRAPAVLDGVTYVPPFHGRGWTADIEPVSPSTNKDPEATTKVVNPQGQARVVPAPLVQLEAGFTSLAPVLRHISDAVHSDLATLMEGLDLTANAAPDNSCPQNSTEQLHDPESDSSWLIEF